MSFESFPFILGWELTLACNLRCRHCGTAAGEPRKKELTLDESLEICDQFPELLVQEVDFTGGEPLMRSGWQKIFARLSKLGIYIKVLTNGLLLDRETVKELKEFSVAGVGVSIDGLDTTHDRIRGHHGLFNRILAGISHVSEANIPVAVITTVNSLNINELPVLFKTLVSIGVSRWQVQPIFILGRAQNNPDLCLSEDDYMKLGEFIHKYEHKANDCGLEIRPGDSFGYFTDLDTREPPWRGCPAGRLSCGITSDGKIKGCLSLPDNIIEGDLRQRDLWNIWFDPDSFAYTRQFSEKKLGPNCRPCDKSELCHGGCSAMSFGVTGEFHNDPYCFYRIRNYCHDEFMSRKAGLGVDEVQESTLTNSELGHSN